MYLLPGSDTRKWTPQQAWTLIKSLARADTLRYNELLLDAAFSGADGEPALAALEQAELITVQSDNGRPCSVKPGKPVYQPAFRRLEEDKVLAAKMDLVAVGETTAKQNRAIDGFEQELKLLAELPKQPSEVYARVSAHTLAPSISFSWVNADSEQIRWLLGNIRTAQEKVEELERKSAELKKILTSEF